MVVMEQPKTRENTSRFLFLKTFIGRKTLVELAVEGRNKLWIILSAGAGRRVVHSLYVDDPHFCPLRDVLLSR